MSNSINSAALTLKTIACIFLSISLLSCTSPTKNQIGAEQHSPVYTAQFVSAVYRLSVGDTLSINVYREADLSGKFKIEPDGSINFPLLGRIRASESTTADLENRIRKGLSDGYMVNPDVRATVVEYQPIYIGGEVEKPGEYKFKPGLTIQQAVTMAGGLTRFAAEKYYLQRRGQPLDEQTRMPKDAALMPGDTIMVNERLF